MYLNEYQALLLLSRFRFPLVPYFQIRTEKEMEPILEKYEITHGIIQTESTEKECRSYEEFYPALRALLQEGKQEGVLIRPFSEVEGEVYLSVSLDACRREHLVSVARGRKGRIDTGREVPLDLFQESILSEKKLYSFQKNRLFHALELEERYRTQFFQIVDKAVDLYFGVEALSVEFNPLFVTYQQKLLVSRVKIEIDNFALFRQPEMDYFFQKNRPVTKEEELKKAGLLYSPGDGSIQLLSMGREFRLAMIDLLQKKGGTAGSSVLLNEEGDMELFPKAMTALLEEKAKVILIVLFGGLKSGEMLFHTALSSINKSSFQKRPLVLHIEAVSMRGMKSLISQVDFPVYLAESLEDAVSKAISLAKEG